MPREDLPVEGPEDILQIVNGDAVRRLENPPAHHIEQDVGEMVCAAQRVAGELKSIRRSVFDAIKPALTGEPSGRSFAITYYTVTK